MGAGAAWLDFDGDGWWDLYLVQSGPFPPTGEEAAANRLFRNLGNGTFQDVTAGTGSGHRGCGQGVVAGDIDGDGDTDLYVTNFGADALLLNSGTGHFVDATTAVGLGVEGWSSSAALGDADQDGDLDLYVSRYMEYDPDHELSCGDPDSDKREYCAPWLFEGSSDRFYLNRGDGSFEDATVEAGVGGASGRGLGVVFLDLDEDGLPEIYVANDLTLNLLYKNEGSGRFRDHSLFSGSAVNRHGEPEAGMGVAVGDVDADGDADLAVTNFDVETNTLYRNVGGLLFEDISASIDFGPASFNLLAFGIVAVDLDRDADLDFYIANGHIYEMPARENVSFLQRDQILLGDGSGGFAELRCQFLDRRLTVARGLARGDFDNDGYPDLAIQENDGPFSLLRIESDSGHWLGLQLRGLAGNTEAIGAKATLVTAGLRQVRWVQAGDSYQSSSDRRLMFGTPVGEVLALELLWPSGVLRRFLSPPVDRYLVIPE
jgi:hypothetical protein